MKNWVWTHGEVIDAAWAETGSVLPMTFDCIIRPGAGRSVDETVRAWLYTGYDRFRAQLGEFKGKVELGVQIFWRVEDVSKGLAAGSSEIGRLQAEMVGKPKGMASFYQQKIEKALKASLETKADGDYRRYYQAIAGEAEDVHFNKVKRPMDGKQMLLNLSLLVRQERVGAVGRALDAIQTEVGGGGAFHWPLAAVQFCEQRRSSHVGQKNAVFPALTSIPNRSMMV